MQYTSHCREDGIDVQWNNVEEHGNIVNAPEVRIPLADGIINMAQKIVKKHQGKYDMDNDLLALRMGYHYACNITCLKIDC